MNKSNNASATEIQTMSCPQPQQYRFHLIQGNPSNKRKTLSSAQDPHTHVNSSRSIENQRSHSFPYHSPSPYPPVSYSNHYHQQQRRHTTHGSTQATNSRRWYIYQPIANPDSPSKSGSPSSADIDTIGHEEAMNEQFSPSNKGVQPWFINYRLNGSNRRRNNSFPSTYPLTKTKMTISRIELGSEDPVDGQLNSQVHLQTNLDKDNSNQESITLTRNNEEELERKKKALQRISIANLIHH